MNKHKKSRKVFYFISFIVYDLIAFNGVYFQMITYYLLKCLNNVIIY